MTRIPFEDNPYAPPAAASDGQGDDRDGKWCLAHAQKYYRRMGFAGLAYIVFVLVFTTASLLGQRKLDIPETVGPLVLCSLLAWLFVTMVRIGYISEAEFPRHYKKARWIGIIVGTLFLPILGLPAYISLRRLSRYHSSLRAESQVH